jgi:hypothetical protein
MEKIERTLKRHKVRGGDDEFKTSENGFGDRKFVMKYAGLVLKMNLHLVTVKQHRTQYD